MDRAWPDDYNEAVPPADRRSPREPPMATPAILMMPAPRVRAGRPYPLGATVTRTGVNFALYSRHATGVRLLLFDHPQDEQPAQELRLTARSAFVWHGHVEGLRPGQLYAYRVVAYDFGIKRNILRRLVNAGGGTGNR